MGKISPAPEPARSPKSDGFRETRKVYNRARVATARQTEGQRRIGRGRGRGNWLGQGQLAGLNRHPAKEQAVGWGEVLRR